jgi:hypothetical protein
MCAIIIAILYNNTMLETPNLMLNETPTPQKQTEASIEKSPIIIAANIYSDLKGTYDTETKQSKLDRDTVNSFLTWVMQQGIDIAQGLELANDEESQKYNAILENSGTNLLDFISTKKPLNQIAVFMKRCQTEGLIRADEVAQLKILLSNLNPKIESETVPSPLKNLPFNELVKILSDEYLSNDDMSSFLGIVSVVLSPELVLKSNPELAILKATTLKEGIPTGPGMAKTLLDTLENSQTSRLQKLKIQSWRKEIGV